MTRRQPDRRVRPKLSLSETSGKQPGNSRETGFARRFLLSSTAQSQTG